MEGEGSGRVWKKETDYLAKAQRLNRVIQLRCGEGKGWAAKQKDLQQGPGAERAGHVGTCKQLSGDGAQCPGQMLSLASRPRSSTFSQGHGPVGGFKCGRDLIRLAFWKGLWAG